MQVSINSVTIEERVRKDVGDLAPLMESLRKYGQLSPIVLTRKNELIAGHRRLLSAKRLGWFTIDAIYVDRNEPADKLEMELQENVHRKDFSPEELLNGYRRLDRLRRPSLGRRVASFFSNIFGNIFRRKKRREEDAGTGDGGTQEMDTADQTLGV